MGGCWLYFVSPETLHIVQICMCSVIDYSLILQASAREKALEYAQVCRSNADLESVKAACMEVKAQECAL